MKDRQRSRGRTKFLTREEELDLIHAWQNDRNEQARVKLIAAYKPLIVGFARRNSRCASDTADMIQEGIYGFIVALEKFDPENGARLGTFAQYDIQRFAREYRLLNNSNGKLPNSRCIKGIEGRVVRWISAIEKEFGVKLTRAQETLICEDEGFTISDLDEYRMFTSLPKPIGPMSEEESGVEISVEADSEDEILATRSKDIVADCLAVFPERTRRILEARYFSDEFISLDRLAAELSISRERIRQIERKALAEMHASLQARGLQLDDLVA